MEMGTRKQGWHALTVARCRHAKASQSMSTPCMRKGDMGTEAYREVHALALGPAIDEEDDSTAGRHVYLLGMCMSVLRLQPQAAECRDTSCCCMKESFDSLRWLQTHGCAGPAMHHHTWGSGVTVTSCRVVGQYAMSRTRACQVGAATLGPCFHINLQG